MANVPMKPAEAWALVDTQTGSAYVCSTRTTKETAESMLLHPTERLARVRITEVEEPNDA